MPTRPATRRPTSRRSSAGSTSPRSSAHRRAAPNHPDRVSVMTGWTAADLPSFIGRSVIVTGANSGLGEVTARELARVGAKVILAVRNTDKGNAAAAGMTGDVEVRTLDLQDLASVRAFAEGVEAV